MTKQYNYDGIAIVVLAVLILLIFLTQPVAGYFERSITNSFQRILTIAVLYGALLYILFRALTYNDNE